MQSPEGVHDTSYPLRKYGKAALFAVAEFVVIVVIVLLVSAGHVRSMPAGTTHNAGLGPVYLVRIQKLKSDEGHTFTYTFYRSAAAVLALCFVVEVFIYWKFARPPDGTGIAR